MSQRDRVLLASLLLSISPALQGQMQPHKQVMSSVRPPLSARPVAAARQSTALAAAARTNPERPKQLPEFSLLDTNGKTVNVRTFAQKTRWLLVYRRAICSPCDRLMTGLAQSPSFQHGAAVFVVVQGAEPAGLLALRTQFPEWSSATWTTDPHGTAAKVLKMRGTPMLYGMDGANIAFALAGNPGGADQTTAAAASWPAQKPADATGEKQ